MEGVQIPTWAWGLIVMVLGGSAALLIKVISYYMSNIDRKIDSFTGALSAVERRLEDRFRSVEHRLTVVETKQDTTHAKRSASGM